MSIESQKISQLTVIKVQIENFHLVSFLVFFVWIDECAYKMDFNLEPSEYLVFFPVLEFFQYNLERGVKNCSYFEISC